MSIRSDRPVTAERIYAALAVLGAEPVADPEFRPEGPREEDHLNLLGSLLAKTKLEITAATRLAEAGEIEDILDVVMGWKPERCIDAGVPAQGAGTPTFATSARSKAADQLALPRLCVADSPG
ncbi:hypothetical protein ACIGHB_30095 [Streptomyces sp. NPDC085460]|uniref:hypothetical protein n=1 Tax=Streptomyces sp. NPDC085460 TaxID=3365723 RepID=UPI0037D1F772